MEAQHSYSLELVWQDALAVYIFTVMIQACSSKVEPSLYKGQVAGLIPAAPILLPKRRAKGFGPTRRRKLNFARFWHFCDVLRSMKIPLREDVLWEWFLSGYSAMDVYDTYKSIYPDRKNHESLAKNP